MLACWGSEGTIQLADFQFVLTKQLINFILVHMLLPEGVRVENLVATKKILGDESREKVG